MPPYAGKIRSATGDEQELTPRKRKFYCVNLVLAALVLLATAALCFMKIPVRISSCEPVRRFRRHQIPSYVMNDIPPGIMLG
jgi:hypothetical protein